MDSLDFFDLFERSEWAQPSPREPQRVRRVPSILRYVGGKTKMLPLIDPRLAALAARHDIEEYREPFMGGGSVALSVLGAYPTARVRINDKDFGVASLWTSIIREREALERGVRAFTPSLAAYDEVRAYLLAGGDPGDPVRTALATLAIHRMTYSGLGLAGGPLGGRKQSSKHGIASRWRPEKICSAVARAHDILRGRVVGDQCETGDFADVLVGADERVLCYLDPPYYKQGPKAYLHSLTDDDHRRLATLLRTTKARWLLSYDDHPFVRALYEGWASIEATSPITYTTAAAREDPKTRRKKAERVSELLITPR